MDINIRLLKKSDLRVQGARANEVVFGDVAEEKFRRLQERSQGHPIGKQQGHRKRIRIGKEKEKNEEIPNHHEGRIVLSACHQNYRSQCRWLDTSVKMEKKHRPW